jgi:hypothetical protein
MGFSNRCRDGFGFQLSGCELTPVIGSSPSLTALVAIQITS